MANAGRSRWGNLLSQAVAGVEARLDTILADEEGGAQGPKTLEQTDSKPPLSPKPSTSMLPAPIPCSWAIDADVYLSSYLEDKLYDPNE